jgi:hypothetical protein
MKRIYLSFLLVLWCVPAWAAREMTALQVRGLVNYQSSGSSEWNPLAQGATVLEGTRVQTASEASCILGFAGDQEGTLKISDSSNVHLKEFSASKTHLSLDQGEIFTKLRKMKRETSFEVRTPTAVATVRGTGWGQSAEKLDVFDGSVHVEGANGEEMEIFEGQSLEINPAGDLGDIGAISEESKEEFEQFEVESSSADTAGSETEKEEESLGESEENALSEEPAFESPDEGFREDVLEAQEDQQEIDDEEEFEDEKDDDGGNYLGGP